MGSTADISLKQIIQRRIAYCQNDNNQELQFVNAGYVRGFNEMLMDIDLSETIFVEKYLNILKDIKKVLEKYEDLKTEVKDINYVDELCGYNNAIVDVLSLIDYRFLYSEEQEFDL